MGSDDKFNPDGSIDYRARRSKKKPRPDALQTRTKRWHRLPGEPDDAWHAFRAYRDIDSRHRSWDTFLVYAVQESNLDPNLCEEWREEWDWERRVELWDSTTAKRLMTRKQMAARKMADRHTKIGQALQSVAATHAAKWAHRPPEEAPMSPGFVVAMARAGVDIERGAVGEPTEVIEVREKADLSKLSLEELKKLREMKRKVDGQDEGKEGDGDD